MVEDFLLQSGIAFEKDVPLARKSWIKTGGICSFWITPDSVDQLVDVCRFLYSQHEDFDIVGQTSNVFFHSDYHPRFVVSTVKVNHYEIEDEIITCDCGVLVVNLAHDALSKGYAGFCGLVGLPGTVASAVYGNAGCFDCSIVSMLHSVEVLLPDGTIRTFTKEELNFLFRSSAFKRREIVGVILSVKLKVEKANDIQEEINKSEKAVNQRRTKQEQSNRTLGSVYSQIKPKTNVRNVIALSIAGVLGKLRLADNKRCYKKIILALYGYKDIAPYVSDRNINTFIWRDEGAEQAFERYKQLMGKMNKKMRIEIEEKWSGKKVGILTYHRAENYGALLQAYALQTYIQQQGCEVSFVDYWPKYHVEHCRVFSLDKFKKRGLKGKVIYLFYVALWGIPKWTRKRRLQRFMRERLELADGIRYSSDSDVTDPYNVVVYGSDQIWRRQSIHKNEFNPWYFGSSNVVAKKKVTYGASMGIIDADENEETQIKTWLGQFDALSMREQNLVDFVEKLGYKAHLVADPVLLMPKEAWRKLYKPVKKRGYILFYNLLDSSESVQFAKSLSRATGLPVKEINMVPSVKGYFSKRYFACASIESFLQLFDGADYVVSNSFHGVAFSLIYEKQFWAVGFGKMKDRAVSLLNSVGLSERFCTSDFSPSMLSQTIDYEPVVKKLDELTKISKDFLNDTLQ